MSQNSDQEYHWVQENEEWRENPDCVGAIYDPNPQLEGWILMCVPNTPQFNLLKNRVFTTTPPVKKRKIDFPNSMPTLTTYEAKDKSSAEIEELVSSGAGTVDLTRSNTPFAASKTAATATSTTDNIISAAPTTPSKPRRKSTIMTANPSNTNKLALDLRTPATPAPGKRVLPNLDQNKSSSSNWRRPAHSPSQIAILAADAKRQYDALSSEQKEVHDYTTKQRRNVFFTGSAGK